ncbi:hypothetical protein KUTeg_013080 [Tegillarca granosa]|uniref:ADP-ribosylation factor n=1 Tax=Tegillarca granosa TaxID=220873 RepID=A0ABQ9EV32_TEGGR|nr:hypothetical protein KUTeg_013080 [Tegillarca granosa]
MKTKRTEMTVPTIGFNVETITLCKGMDVTVWDVGGLFFIIDSNDRERVAEAKEALYGILESESMANVPLVVIANKQDLPNAMGPIELEKALDLSSLTNRKWMIQKTCAIKGDGLTEAMKEMARLIKEQNKK